MKFAISYTKKNTDGSIEHVLGEKRYTKRDAIEVLKSNGFEPYRRDAEKKLPSVFKGNNRMAHILREDEI